MRIDIARQNLLNEQTVCDVEGRPNPYRRRLVEWEPTSRTYRIIEDSSPFTLRFDPGHPFADVSGYVRFPNVDRAIEEVLILEAEEELARTSGKRSGT
jgi:flagellar basal-body rod protein FlgC